jgi:dTDP-4-dehydrorhamnose reductase
VVEKIKSKILITGAEGMLGSAVLGQAAERFSSIPTTFQDLDITDSAKIGQRFKEEGPQIVVHTAAYTDVDGCEKNPEVAYRVNVEGARNIAQACRETGAALIFISSDYVFDGEKRIPYTEQDPANPLGVYGKNKLEAEAIVRRLLTEHLIIRSSFLFGKGKKGFVEKILEQARRNKTIKVVGDKYGSPTYVNDLAGAILSLCDLLVQGKFAFSDNNIINITNSGFCSWLEYAQKAVEFSGIKGITILPARLADFPFVAKRPVFSVLDNSKFKGITGKTLRPWQEALKEYLKCSTN